MRTEASHEPFLVTGLGNPGRQFRGHRHNVGYMVVDRLGVALKVVFRRSRARARIAHAQIDGQDLILAKPQSFMNKSGKPVKSLREGYRVPLHHLLVIYDDLDLPFGRIRLRPEGGAGGHRGVQSVITELSSKAFPRLRVGIGRPPGRMDPAEFVLRPFSRGEEEELTFLLDRAVDCVLAFLKEGLEPAMSRYNSEETL
jgi:PTH1 family peptidyl-tRNA hydrolase